jgi:ganglioside-induced differentiation-associated protein 1
MLELYHHGSSVCAAKVRMVLSEKDMEWTGHYIDILKGEQFTPEYLALNPKGVVPILIDDGTIIRESTVICEYIDHIHPDTPLRPTSALEAARMRNWTKFVDEYIHPMCATLTFTCSHRVTMNRLPSDEVDTLIAKTPDAGLRKRKREWFDLGFEGPEFIKAVQVFEKMLADMETALVDHKWLAGNSLSLADIGVLPYVNRLAMFTMLEKWPPARPRALDWFERMKARSSFEPAVNEYLPESLANDFRTNGAKSWPEVEKVLKSL